MKAERFNEVFAETIKMSSDVLVSKAGEYADDTDRLRNFKIAGYLQECSPREALAGMLAKHTVSVYDLMLGDGFPSLEKWDEKIIDHINYLILLRCLVVEQLDLNEQGDIPNA